MNESDNKLPVADDTSSNTCSMVGLLGILIQIGLGLLSFSVLLVKRCRQKPKRPWRIWILDTSKQIISQTLAHFINLTISIALSYDDDGSDECLWYLATNIFDNTIGVLICCFSIWLIEKRFTYTNQPEYISGNYYTKVVQHSARTQINEKEKTHEIEQKELEDVSNSQGIHQTNLIKEESTYTSRTSKSKQSKKNQLIEEEDDSQYKGQPREEEFKEVVEVYTVTQDHSQKKEQVIQIEMKYQEQVLVNQMDTKVQTLEPFIPDHPNIHPFQIESLPNTQQAHPQINLHHQSPSVTVDQYIINYKAWIIQLLIWISIVIAAKCILFGLEFALESPLEKVTYFTMGWIEAYPVLELVVVIVVVPVIMNGFAYWVQDNFLKKKEEVKIEDMQNENKKCQQDIIEV